MTNLTFVGSSDNYLRPIGQAIGLDRDNRAVGTGGAERAWSFLVIEEERRQHLGNEGYDDRVGEY